MTKTASSKSVKTAWEEIAEGPFTFLTGQDASFGPPQGGPGVGGGRGRASSLSFLKLPRLFPRFDNPVAEEEYTRGRNVALVASLRVFCKVWGVMLLMFLPFRAWGQAHLYVDMFSLAFWLGSWLILAVISVAARYWPGGVPKHFDLWLALGYLFPFFALLSLDAARIAKILGVEDMPQPAGEVTVVCYVCGFFSIMTHLMRLSTLTKFLLVHAAAGFYFIAAAWYSSELNFRSIVWVATTMYFQFSICFIGARNDDREIRQHWLLKRAARSELYQMQEYITHKAGGPSPLGETKAGDQKDKKPPRAKVPHSIQEEAAMSLERLKDTLGRVLQRGVVAELPLVELLQLCNQQVDDALSVLRKTAAAGSHSRKRAQLLFEVDPATFCLDYRGGEEYVEQQMPFTPESSHTPADFDTLFPSEDGLSPLRTDTTLSECSIAAHLEQPLLENEVVNILMIAENNSELVTLRQEIGQAWDMDAIHLDQSCSGHGLEIAGIELLYGPMRAGLLENEPVLNFLSSLGAIYKPNPYHNAIHATDVASGFVSLLRKCARLWEDPLGPVEWSYGKELNQTAAAVAALAHDVGHPGVNNTFLSNMLAPLAVTYNDISVLENFHAAVTFSMLMRPNCRIFARLDRALFVTFRKQLVDLILATDIKNHFTDLSAFRLRMDDPTLSLAWDMAPGNERAINIHDRERSTSGRVTTDPPRSHSGRTGTLTDMLASSRTGTLTDMLASSSNGLQPASPEDVKQVQLWLMRAADIGHSAKRWHSHQEWTRRITEEFHMQGDEEVKRGLPIGPLNKREGFNLAKSQTGFLQFVCLPLWIEVARLDEHQHGGTGYSLIHETCRNNLLQWLKQEEPPPPPE